VFPKKMLLLRKQGHKEIFPIKVYFFQTGHDAQLISAKLVASIRQNQKTDKNDALAIVQPRN
jgi:hypothetical protein